MDVIEIYYGEKNTQDSIERVQNMSNELLQQMKRTTLRNDVKWTMKGSQD